MPIAQNVIAFLYDGHDPTKDYKTYDIVDIQEGVKSNGTLRTPWLPPAPPFFLVRIWGPTKEQVRFLMDVDFAGESIQQKRFWQIRTQNIPGAIKAYFGGHRFVGFGSAEDHAYYDAVAPGVIDGDYQLSWADVGGWLYNKTTKQTADEVLVL